MASEIESICYHELGHVIMAYLTHPQKRYVKEISIKHTINQGIRSEAFTNYKGKYSLYCSYKDSYDYFRKTTMVSLAGGIFQQMMEGVLVANISISHPSMTIDKEVIYRIYKQIKHDYPQFNCNWNVEITNLKGDVINKLMPFVKCKDIKNFTSYVKKASLNKKEISISKGKIEKMLLYRYSLLWAKRKRL